LINSSASVFSSPEFFLDLFVAAPGLLVVALPPLHPPRLTAVCGRQANIAVAKNDTSFPALVAFSAEVSGNGYQLLS
jgi:hypothetical protein